MERNTAAQRPPATSPCLQEDEVPMVVEVLLLPRRKRADLDRGTGLQTHAFKRDNGGHWRDQQSPAVMERDEASVEQVVDRMRQQQAVLAIETLFVVSATPGLDVASDEVRPVFDPTEMMMAAREIGLEYRVIHATSRRA